MKFIASLLILLLSFFIYKYKVDGEIDEPAEYFSCEGNIKYSDSSLAEPIVFMGTITFSIGMHHRGSMLINGRLEREQERYRILRLLRFAYHIPKGNEYRLKFDKASVMGKDNIPDHLFEVVLNQASIRDEMSLYISPMGENAVSIGLLSSPIMVCVITE